VRRVGSLWARTHGFVGLLMSSERLLSMQLHLERLHISILLELEPHRTFHLQHAHSVAPSGGECSTPSVRRAQRRQ
jgi:hypothetical protein